eukprot:s369_g37.t3
MSGQDEKGEVPSASARPPLPGFSAKTERWVMELVYGRRCEAEEKYLKERRLNVPVTKVPLYKNLGFRAIKHPSYIEVRPATPSVASKASKASRLSVASGASGRSRASLGRRICSQPMLVPIEEPAEVPEEEEVQQDAQVPQQTSSAGFVMPKYAHAKYSMRHMYLAECGARNNSMRNVRNVIKPLPNARAAAGAPSQVWRKANFRASKVIKVRAAKGEKCGSDTPCGEGLICSPGSKICKPALMSPCKRSSWDAIGKTECAGKSTYNRVTMCSEPDSHGNSVCCIKSKLPLVPAWSQEQRGPLDPSDDGKECCSGRYEWVDTSFEGEAAGVYLCVLKLRAKWVDEDFLCLLTGIATAASLGVKRKDDPLSSWNVELPNIGTSWYVMDGASLVSLSESDQDDGPEEKRTAATEGKKALAADAASVTKAAKTAREAFELQELKLLDLIKSKRQALKPLQGNLAKQQPELADQLRKISEANRSVAMTKHALKRDQKVLERSQGKCAVLSKAKKFEEDQRPQVRVQVIMAISFLKAMARKAGIDLNPGAMGPSFLQLDSKDSELSEAVRSALHHIESLDDSRYEVNFQAEASNESDDAVTVPLESNLVQVDAAQKAASSEAADSLKNVKEMIANLIASLREEQNEDQGKQKFCVCTREKSGRDCFTLQVCSPTMSCERSSNDLRFRERSRSATRHHHKGEAETAMSPAAEVVPTDAPTEGNSVNVDDFFQPKWWIPEVEGVSVGDYQFLQVLGEGTHGKVYKVADQICGGFNAVKVIRKNRLKSADEIYGIAGECNTLAWLQHPNIIRLRGAVHASQNYYVFMEFAGSVSLHNVLRARGSQVGLDRNMAHQVFNQIADAVAYCHSHGLAHCDLKPQNIVLNDDGIPKIVDFGLALKIGWPVGNPRGTWPFTAPEAAWPCGRPWDLAKADVFSLAAVLIEMLCGTDKTLGLFRMFGWMVETPLNLLRVQEMVAFLATPGAVAMSLATDIGASAEWARSPGNVASMITGMMNVLPMKRWSAKADQLKKAQEKTKKLKTAQEEVEQSKRWAENAVNDLKVQSRFIEGEVKLLKEAKTSSKEELDAEEKRVKDEVKNHEATTDVMSKSQQVLVTQCELSEDDLSSNCAEANAALRRASAGLKELDKYLASYLVEFSKVAEEQQAEIDKTLSAQEGSLFQTKADLNRRKDELAQLNADVVTAKENAILAGKADSALAANCGPKVSTAEELIATRKEQIEQLKNAVKVLDGQAFV